MPLSPEQRARVTAEAERRGADPKAAIAEAERVTASRAGSAPAEGDAPSPSGKPTFERLLIGVLPFIKVRELRTEWLGLTERITDDEMTCGEFAAKYGGAPAQSPAADEVPQ